MEQTLSSLPGEAQQIGEAVRRHHGVENGLHWVMDMVFRDDECRIRSENAAGQLCHDQAHGEQSAASGQGQDSMRSSRHVAAWNEDFLYSLLTE